MMNSTPQPPSIARAMVIPTKRSIMEALRAAMDYCGYDLYELMSSKVRTRVYADLRAIVWSIYQDELKSSSRRVGYDFGWSRATVYSAVTKANELKTVDREFSDMYDAIHGAFINALSLQRENNKKEIKTA